VADEVRVWGLHCNEDVDLVGQGVAAMGWDELGDLTQLDPPTVPAFKQAMTSTWAGLKPGTVAQWAGQLFHFVHDAEEGDIVVYRERGGGPINVGRITGPYQQAQGELYSQRRPVKWEATGLVPSAFPPGALYELGAFLTWFRLRRYAEVWTDLLTGKTPSPELAAAHDRAAEDGSQLDARAIDQATRDFLIRRLSKHFKGHGFARLTAHLLELMDYTTTVFAPGKDYGVDIVAHRGILGLEPPLIKVQVKSSDDHVGGATVAQLLGRLAPSEAGLFVTLGHYTPDAWKLAGERANLRLIDGPEFVDLLLAHYDELDDEYRSRFPLRRVWARDLASEADEEGG
jgi:restriction system protein